MPSDLELAESKHKYRFGSGELPGATSICGLLDSGGKASRMAGAAAKITREGGNYRAEWKAKTDRGTRIHNMIERWLMGSDATVGPEDTGFMDAAEKYLIERPHTWHHVERIVVGDGWGGRIDAIGLDHVSGRVALRDWKSGKPYTEHLLQKAAYANAIGFAVYDVDGNYAGIEPMPEVGIAGDVYLHEDGTYETSEYTRSELIAAYEAFRGLLDVYRWLQGIK